ncbi:hypothetical protein [Anabaena azotica]|uniref:hypothetical protein n=1 Tax=Anabaena azotica TaxID=197653 RepID=UPI0039A46196
MFSEASNWNQVFFASRNAVTNQNGEIIQRIGSIEIIHTFNSNTIGCLATSSRADWYKAGYLSQVIQAPLGMSGYALGESEFIRLFIATICKFQKFESSYSLSFDVPFYFKDITLTIWEFTGQM